MTEDEHIPTTLLRWLQMSSVGVKYPRGTKGDKLTCSAAGYRNTSFPSARRRRRAPQGPSGSRCGCGAWTPSSSRASRGRRARLRPRPIRPRTSRHRTWRPCVSGAPMAAPSPPSTRPMSLSARVRLRPHISCKLASVVQLSDSDAAGHQISPMMAGRM